MFLASAEQVLTTELISGFSGAGIPYILDNAPEEFSDQNFETEKVEAEITVVASKQASLGEVGTRLFRRSGDIIFRVYTKRGIGSRRDKEIKDIILNLFEGKNFSGIVTQSGTFVSLGSIGDWYLTTVRISFYFNTEGI